MANEPQELSEDDLFDSAVSDAPAEPAAAEPAAEPAAEAAEQPGQPRDEAGRFAGKPEAEPEAEAAAELPPIPPKPEWRKAEDAAARRAAEAELANERAEKAALRQRLEALERAQKPEPAVEKAAKPDPLLDPEGFEKYLETKVETRILNDRRDLDLELTRNANTEAFDKAHNEAMRLKAAGAPEFGELSQKMQSSLQPGKVLLNWHKERTVREEIGGDLAAYKQRIRDEALKDPEYRKAAMAAWQSEAQPQVNGRPRVDLPPSLNGASRSNAALRSAMTADIDDDALFEQTTA